MSTLDPNEPICANSIPLIRLFRGGVSGSLGLGSPQLRRPVLLLHGLLALADGRGAGDGVAAEVGSVAALGGAVDDGGVGPAFLL